MGSDVRVVVCCVLMWACGVVVCGGFIVLVYRGCLVFVRFWVGFGCGCSSISLLIWLTLWFFCAGLGFMPGLDAFVD